MVDPDDRRTWPPAVADWVYARAEQLLGIPEFASELEFPIEEEDDFRALLRGSKVRSYHCTRLLDHEAERIRRQGLRPLTAELVESKILEAFESGAIDKSRRDALRRWNVFAQGEAENREERIGLNLGRRPFDERPYLFAELLSRWGGEALYVTAIDHCPWLEQLGRPTIVVAAIDLSPSRDLHSTTLPLHKLFAGVALDLKHADADVTYRAAILPEDILDIWQPGDDHYDRHRELPEAG